MTPFRETTQLARVRTWVMAASLFGFVLLAGEAGMIPGLDPQSMTFVSWPFDALAAIVDAIFSVAAEIES